MGLEEAIKVAGIYLDLADPESVDRVVTDLLHGSGVPDVLVNAAGILHLGPVASLSVPEWYQTFAVNVHGVFHIFQKIVPLFKERRRGAVVTVASNAAHVPRTEMAAYSASKAALKALCQSVALELAPYGVRCNIISPGSTETPMQRAMWTSEEDRAKVIAGSPERFRLGIPLGKLATPLDVANLALFLASDLAGHITLQDIVIDGGATLGA